MKQRKIKVKPRIKLNYNIYTWLIIVIFADLCKSNYRSDLPNFQMKMRNIVSTSYTMVRHTYRHTLSRPTRCSHLNPWCAPALAELYSKCLNKLSETRSRFLNLQKSAKYHETQSNGRKNRPARSANICLRHFQLPVGHGIYLYICLKRKKICIYV